MTTIIKKVSNKKELKQFIRFNYELYKNNPYSVPDLYEDMLKTFSPQKNPAFEFCEADYFLAIRDGRVVAIVNHRANAKWGKKAVRFGWIDFIDDEEVSRCLIEAVEAWGRERGLDTIEGPLGFTDLDAEGMLIEGFDQLSTMATIYNYPYYPVHMERLGMKKEMDWIEMKLKVPVATPEKYVRISEVVKAKFHLHVRKLKNMREIRETGIGYRIFDLINEAYSSLFNFSEMTKGQIDQYINELDKQPTIKTAFKTYWANKGISVDSIESEYLRPYNDEITGVPNITIKVPTAGGKTYIACKALKHIFQNIR